LHLQAATSAACRQLGVRIRARPWWDDGLSGQRLLALHERSVDRFYLRGGISDREPYLHGQRGAAVRRWPQAARHQKRHRTRVDLTGVVGLREDFDCFRRAAIAGSFAPVGDARPHCRSRYSVT
jgi:hypothetical protein